MVKQLKLAAQALEHLPQEVSVLGSARQVLEEVLVDKHVLGSKHKDVRMYLAVCLAHMLRIYAPDTPWEDSRLEVSCGNLQHAHHAQHDSANCRVCCCAIKSFTIAMGCPELTCLQPLFDLLLWSIQQVGEFQAPMFELAVSVLQTISQVSWLWAARLK